MSECGNLPPGVGVKSSVFPINKIYDTYTVTYTTVGGVEVPTEVKYFDTLATLITTVTITYDFNGDPVWNGDTLKNQRFNIFTAEFELVDIGSREAAAAAHTQTELATITLLGLSTDNMLTDNAGYDIITENDGSILYSPTIG